MSFTFNGLSGAAVTISGSIAAATPVPSSSQTHVVVAASSTGSNQNVYTVTTGKTFYLMGFGGTDAAAFNSYLYKSDGTTLLARSNPGASGAGQGSLQSSCPIAVYPSGTNVVMKVDNSHTYAMWGVEQ